MRAGDKMALEKYTHAALHLALAVISSTCFYVQIKNLKEKYNLKN